MNIEHSVETVEASLKKIAALSETVERAMDIAQKETERIHKYALLSVADEMEQVRLEEKILHQWTLANLHKLNSDRAIILKNGNVGFSRGTFPYRLKYGVGNVQSGNYPCIVSA